MNRKTNDAFMIAKIKQYNAQSCEYSKVHPLTGICEYFTVD